MPEKGFLEVTNKGARWKQYQIQWPTNQKILAGVDETLYMCMHVLASIVRMDVGLS